MKILNKVKETRQNFKTKKEEQKKKDVMTLIDTCITECKEKRDEYDVSSKEYTILTNEMAKLTELRIEAEEMRTKNVMKKFEVIIQGVGVGAGLVLKAAFFKAGMMFEKTGVFTSSIFKTFWNWIKEGKEK